MITIHGHIQMLIFSGPLCFALGLLLRIFHNSSSTTQHKEDRKSPEAIEGANVRDLPPISPIAEAEYFRRRIETREPDGATYAEETVYVKHVATTPKDASFFGKLTAVNIRSVASGLVSFVIFIIHKLFGR